MCKQAKLNSGKSEQVELAPGYPAQFTGGNALGKTKFMHEDGGHNEVLGKSCELELKELQLEVKEMRNREEGHVLGRKMAESMLLAKRTEMGHLAEKVSVCGASLPK